MDGISPTSVTQLWPSFVLCNKNCLPSKFLTRSQFTASPWSHPTCSTSGWKQTQEETATENEQRGLLQVGVITIPAWFSCSHLRKELPSLGIPITGAVCEQASLGTGNDRWNWNSSSVPSDAFTSWAVFICKSPVPAEPSLTLCHPATIGGTDQSCAGAQHKLLGDHLSVHQHHQTPAPSTDS